MRVKHASVGCALSNRAKGGERSGNWKEPSTPLTMLSTLIGEVTAILCSFKARISFCAEGEEKCLNTNVLTVC